MGKLVQQNSDEIVLRSVVVVEAQVEVDGCGEIRVDVVKGWGQIAPASLFASATWYCVPGKGAFGKLRQQQPVQHFPESLLPAP